jgi:hypothetical protein
MSHNVIRLTKEEIKSILENGYANVTRGGITIKATKDDWWFDRDEIVVCALTEDEEKIFEEFKKIVGNDNARCPVCKSRHFHPKYYNSEFVSVICHNCYFISKHCRQAFLSLPVMPEEGPNENH